MKSINLIENVEHPQLGKAGSQSWEWPKDLSEEKRKFKVNILIRDRAGSGG